MYPAVQKRFLGGKKRPSGPSLCHDVTASTAPKFGGISLVALIPVRDLGWRMMPAARCEPVLQTRRVGLLSVPFELLAAHWLIAQPNITRPEHRVIGEQIHLALSG